MAHRSVFTNARPYAAAAWRHLNRGWELDEREARAAEIGQRRTQYVGSGWPPAAQPSLEGVNSRVVAAPPFLVEVSSSLRASKPRSGRALGSSSK